MLLIKCPQCSASYRLAETLYRRKAAGYGVVITCRRCKHQIHIDEGSLPAPAAEGDTSAPETPEADVVAGRAPLDTTPLAAAATPALPTASSGLPAPDPSNPDDDTTNDAVNALPNVAPKPPVPRPGGVPRPGTGAPRPAPVAPRRGGTLLGIQAPPSPPWPSVSTAPKKDSVGDGGWKPKLVALSPGLLGVETATHGAPPGAKAPPGPPHKTRHVEEEEPAPDSVVPISEGSLQLLDSGTELDPVTLPPDSAMPVDSVDYLSGPFAPQSVPPPPPPVPPPPPEDGETTPDETTPTPTDGHAKRLPHAPPARHLPKEAYAGEPGKDELPSGSGTPSMSELALGSSPLPLSQKKGEKKGDKQRKRQHSSDLTDELLGTDVGFDAPRAIAPPDAGALTRAPISSRPAPAASATAARASTKAPVSKSDAAPEKKGSGKGLMIVVVMAAFGGIGYALQHRALVKEPSPAPEPQAAVTALVPERPPEPPAAEAESAAPVAPEPSAPAPVEAPAAIATANRAGNAATTGTPGPVPTTVKTAKAAAPPVAPPAATAEKVATTPSAPTTPAVTSAPKSSAVIEPRGSVGTEPFDVAAARTALDASAGQASGCRKEGDPSGLAVVTLTFSQTGRVTSANISGPPFQATLTGGCIASTMRKTRVPAFAGEMVTVRKTVTIQ